MSAETGLRLRNRRVIASEHQAATPLVDHAKIREGGAERVPLIRPCPLADLSPSLMTDGKRARLATLK
jgi:hypothetical protein